MTLVVIEHTASNDGIPPAPTNSAKSYVSPVTKQITIDIEGTVEKPGVYKLPSDSRVQDALVQAGGLTQNANHQKVAQILNLAAPLTDSAKLYIPTVGEQYSASEGTTNSSSGNAVQGNGQYQPSN